MHQGQNQRKALYIIFLFIKLATVATTRETGRRQQQQIFAKSLLQKVKSVQIQTLLLPPAKLQMPFCNLLSKLQF